MESEMFFAVFICSECKKGCLLTNSQLIITDNGVERMCGDCFDAAEKVEIPAQPAHISPELQRLMMKMDVANMEATLILDRMRGR